MSAAEESSSFYCEPYRTTLERQRCGERFAQATSKGADFQWRVSLCRGCPVGRAHAHGEIVPLVWPKRSATPASSDEDVAAIPPGTRFGRWTVVRAAAPDSRGRRCVFARCVCGEERPVSVWSLRHGQSRGCSKKSCQRRGEQSPATPAEEDPVAEKTCKTCGKSFEGHGRAMYCSDGCRPDAILRQRKSRVAAKRSRARELAPAVEPRADVDIDAARELLELAGYTVRAISTPAGVMLFIADSPEASR